MVEGRAESVDPSGTGVSAIDVQLGGASNLGWHGAVLVKCTYRKADRETERERDSPRDRQRESER